MINNLHGQIPRLKVSSNERGYVEHKKCFKLCLKSFEANALSQDEKACIVGCLGKYKESERYLSEKVHKLMTEHAAQNQEISALYDANLDGAKNSH